MTKKPELTPLEPPTGYRTSAVTQAKLIEAAGELFADHGFEGTSTRAIADKAGVKLGSIHYHFGSKEALYLAAFRHICFGDGQAESPVAELADAFVHDPARPGRTAAHIVEVVRAESRWLLAMDQPAWHSRLLMQGTTQRNPATRQLIDEIFRPGYRRWERLHRQVHPEAGERAARIWAMNQAGFYALYAMLRETVALVMERPVDAAFLDAAIRHAAATRILSLGLPLPPDLEVW